MRIYLTSTLLPLFIAGCSLFSSADSPSSDSDAGSDLSETEDVGETDRPICIQYCDEFKSVCLGENYTYQDDDDCLAKCGMLASVPSAEGAYQGDTVECRLAHLDVGALDPDLHCPHAQFESTANCEVTPCARFCASKIECATNTDSLAECIDVCIGVEQNCVEALNLENVCVGTLDDCNPI